MTAPLPEDHVEVEWQFETTDVAAAAAWVAGTEVAGYRVTAVGVKQPRDTYYDTATWAVHRAGFTCRVREKGDSAELTLKSMAESRDGIRSRREMTEPLPAGARPFAAPGVCGETLRSLAGRGPLVALFTLAQVRHIFVLEDDEGPLAEVAVDDTAVLREGGDAVHLGRVEVEVLPDALSRAGGWVTVLAASLGLQPAETSKFAAGLAVAGLEPLPREPSLGPSVVAPVMTAADAAFAVLRRQFAAIVANEPGTRLGEDSEALHDMRVATRRTRAALSLFAPYLPPAMHQFRLEFGRVAAALGEVRDLDVQLERARSWEAALPARAAALQPVEDLLRTRREAARRRMLAVLNARSYGLLLRRYRAALDQGAPADFVDGQVPVAHAGPDLVAARYAKVLKRGRRIRPWSPPADYHRLRIDVKKLRYALEFLGPLYGSRGAEFTASLVRLQDLLGLHQDADVAVEALDAMAASVRRLPPETLMAMGAVAERYRVQADVLRRQFPVAFKRVEGRAWQRLEARLAKSRRAAAHAPVDGLPSPQPS